MINYKGSLFSSFFNAASEPSFPLKSMVRYSMRQEFAKKDLRCSVGLLMSAWLTAQLGGFCRFL